MMAKLEVMGGYPNNRVYWCYKHKCHHILEPHKVGPTNQILLCTGELLKVKNGSFVSEN